jgi:hypothetical protein
MIRHWIENGDEGMFDYAIVGSNPVVWRYQPGLGLDGCILGIL